MTEYVKIYCCGDCGYYDWKKHKCKRGAKDDDGSRFFRDCPIGIHKEKDGEQPQTEQHKSADKQYFGYLLDNPWWRCGAEAESFAALMFIDDIEDWKNEG